MKENRQTKMPRTLVAVIIVMLGIALLPIRWYGYYILLKLVVCGGCVFLAANAYDDGSKHFVWFLGGLAVLYNPIIRFPIGRELWIAVNILTIIVLIAAMRSLKK